MADKKLQEVLLFNHFGECPICAHRLNLLQSEYTAYALSSVGWITSKLDSMCKYTQVCPNCGYTCEVGINEYGIYPLKCVDNNETRKPIITKNPLGKDYE